MNYIVEGMKHCGKSTFGKRLAKHLNAPFYDSDDLLKDLYKKRYNDDLSVRDIFIKHGSDFFKELEIDVLKELNSTILLKFENNVIGLGGGLPINLNATDLLKDMGTIIFLKNDLETLYKRVLRNGKVPFLDNNNPKESFFELYNEREPFYRDIADITVNLKDCSVDENWVKMLETIEKYNKRGLYVRK